jgi:metallo-beta-lactamase family protein
MKLTFHGAARTVTGSKHIISLDNGTNILLDCGMFQGLGQKTDDLNEKFGFNPKTISYLLLSHAHIDHTGLIPKLVKEGFEGKIYCTPATRDLTEILLYDSAEIQTYEIDHINKRRAKKNLPPYEPLYTSEDVAATLPLFELVDYDTWIDISDDVSVFYTNTGHLIGSAAINIKIKEDGKETSIAFSGDVGRQRSVLLPSPVPIPQADYIIMESTYGSSRHDISFNVVKTLRQWIEKTCVERGGKLVIPAFSVGRTQEVLYGLNQLSLEKRLPQINYFIDSPLSLKATETIKKYSEHFNERLQQVLRIDDDPFHFEGLKYVESVEDSQRLVDHQEPCVIISASGTADAGRVRHHINSIISEEKNSILFVGYCGEESLGGQLLNGCNEVELFGDPSPVKAEVGRMAGMSAHGDCDELSQFLSEQDPEKVKQVFLVHGEYTVQKEFAAKLGRRGYQVEIPSPHQSYDL